MKTLVLKTENAWAPLVSRLLLGIVLFPHGAQKLLGWFGGYGFTGTMNFFTETMSLPWLVAFSVIIIEFFGALLLIAGYYTRVVSILILGLFIGILFTSHLDYGFFMNWFGNQKGEGMEYFLLLFGLSASLIFSGGGKFSIDSRITQTL
ncbi:MAG: DoxX family protein [Bacteroidia bacterium]|nr:DoxX family protein [Bacteroidia bacterium]